MTRHDSITPPTHRRSTDTAPKGPGRIDRTEPTSANALHGWRGIIVACGVILTLCFWLYRNSLHETHTVVGLRINGHAFGVLPYSNIEPALQKLAGELDSTPIVLRHEGTCIARLKASKLGIGIDRQALTKAIQNTGRSGSFFPDLHNRIIGLVRGIDLPLPLTVDSERLFLAIGEIKNRTDRASVEPHMNLDDRVITKGRDGSVINIAQSATRIEQAISNGKTTVELASRVVSPPKKKQLLGLKIDHILGQYITVYSQADIDRNRAHNLALGAARINGTIISPGASFSYNDVVGPRTQKHGYSIAPVISQGEVVDGVAGGACQLSSTLFAAAFFAGLDLTRSRPHTIPSSYIKMGLDAAVAYPEIDFVFRNPYPFAVVLQLKVSRGKVFAAILGKKRPWRQIVFKRTVLQKNPFEEIQRDDPKVPRGQRYIARRGIPGYHILRERLFYGAKENTVKKEARKLTYPPTTQIVTVGTGPAQIPCPACDAATKQGTPVSALTSVEPEISIAQ